MSVAPGIVVIGHGVDLTDVARIERMLVDHGDRFVERVFTRKIFARRDGPHPLSAIQITTAAGLCAVLDLFRQGSLPQRGFIRQEQVRLADFLGNRFGRVYEELRPVSEIA